MTKKFNENLKIQVSDKVAPGDVMGGTPKEDPPKEKTPQEQAMDLLNLYVEPHTKVARKVEDTDVLTVLAEAKKLLSLCSIPRGGTTGAKAIAHPQICDTDPLAFFVTEHGEVIINPTITRTSNYHVDKEEGCTSFPSSLPVPVQRFHVITALFQTLLKGENGEPEISAPQEVTLSGKQAQVFQHECSHLLGKTIYDEGASAEDCIERVATLDINKSSI